MSDFSYRDGALFAEDVALEAIADEFGTPTFVYSRAAITKQLASFAEAFSLVPHELCYSVKANSNLGILSLVAREGAAFDIVSGGELERVRRAGGDLARVVFSGVGKQRWEMRMALEAGIACFNVESTAELATLNEVAGEMGLVAPVSLRVNPDVDPQTHPYISTGLTESKFGIPGEEAMAAYRAANAMPHIRITGIDCHIGSQITTLSPFLDAYSRLLELHDALAREGMPIEHIDIGGGMGVTYQDEAPLDLGQLADGLRQLAGSREFALKMEPGRSIVANAGVLLSRVIYRKRNGARAFAIVDAAMNDLIRPALYEAWQSVMPVKETGERGEYLDVVGPVCESGDFLALDRKLYLEADDLVAIGGCGAYSFSMSSNYNTRNRAAEVIVDGREVHLVRARESIDDQLRLETTLPGGSH